MGFGVLGHLISIPTVGRGSWHLDDAPWQMWTSLRLSLPTSQSAPLKTGGRHSPLPWSPAPHWSQALCRAESLIRFPTHPVASMQGASAFPMVSSEALFFFFFNFEEVQFTHFFLWLLVLLVSYLRNRCPIQHHEIMSVFL